jgi:hypothetical protein
MLVEEEDRGNVVPCLICKTPIRVGGSSGQWTAKSDQQDKQKRDVSKEFDIPD